MQVNGPHSQRFQLSSYRTEPVIKIFFKPNHIDSDALSDLGNSEVQMQCFSKCETFVQYAHFCAQFLMNNVRLSGSRTKKTEFLISISGNSNATKSLRTSVWRTGTDPFLTITYSIYRHWKFDRISKKITCCKSQPILWNLKVAAKLLKSNKFKY